MPMPNPNMEDEMFSDAATEEAGSEMPSEQPESPEDAGSGSTALLPLSFFGDKNPQPGDECTVKVERVHDDQVEVSYSKEEESEDLIPAEAPLPDTEDEYGNMME